MDVKVYNQEGQEAGTMELPKVFELPWNADLVHQVVTSQSSNRRQVIAHTKGRREVRGGGRKPWRQKGTGRARHGSIRSPLWKGGGVTHGPTKDRNFKKKINKKMAARALATVLSAKIRDNEIIALDNFVFSRPKTKEAAKMFGHLSKIKGFSGIVSKIGRALVLLSAEEPELKRIFRNLPAVELGEAQGITAWDVLNRKYVVLSKSGFESLAKRLKINRGKIRPV